MREGKQADNRAKVAQRCGAKSLLQEMIDLLLAVIHTFLEDEAELGERVIVVTFGREPAAARRGECPLRRDQRSQFHES